MSIGPAEHTVIGPGEDNSETPAPMSVLSPGEKLDKFEIVRELGRGGMGVIYLARDLTLDRQVAIKVLSPQFSRDKSSLGRFLTEARSAGQLNHPNVVSVYEVVQRPEFGTYIVMEYLPNGSVAERLQNRVPSDTKWATAVVLDAAKGLAAAHEIGLTHRDIKPANLLVADHEVVKVGDFGLARAQRVEDARLTQNGQILGTPYFMSPEQCVGKEVDARSDLYSLGATYFTLLAGVSPFEESGSTMEIIVAHVNRPAPNLASLHPKIPGVCSRIVERALSKNPDDRYQTAEEMIADLEVILPILEEGTASVTFSYRGGKTNKLDSLVLPSERKDPPSSGSRSSILSRMTRRTSKNSDSQISRDSASRHSAIQLHSSPSSASKSIAEKNSSSDAIASHELQKSGSPLNRVVESPDHDRVREDVFTVEAGNVILAWPTGMTSQEVDGIERWFELMIEKLRHNSKPQ
ncbi:serine/threonine-protein kinase [Rubinisphaera italica]|uniref:non-specific serine/threonine protein kinase n=1 Tax=Rubinisphaera italica TaxID=2527969 RepID=A0A5C5XHY7_9PLAN|nr:serine/threonine-protein kinase [Rubinisphaera italica]TWT61765.1 Serine/threonine-protein kinase PknB [Rubinisphaera italica]